ncbi:MAG: TonB-dependent receptor, partial [Cruoricaptor ignavus]|nr:TonB-dependent receptor [Cruoricaptor ignavus]
MRIFSACTDKMDPVTSYVEISNLSEAEVSSGQQGSCHGSTIGGTLDLKRNKGNFGKEKWDFGLNSGYESVNQQKIFGGGIKFRNEKIFADTNFMMRDAENYKAGGNTEVLYSQFKKINFSGTIGFKINEQQTLESSVIYDKATDVGYPALPMDVSLAEAVIASLRYNYRFDNSIFKNWETKIYFNKITHKMDDSQRPDVPIRMDMPGWSDTYGFYSRLNLEKKRHNINFNLNGFYNKSLAEMTMYPNNPAENPMFMYTWPDVKTLYQGIFVEDEFQLNPHSTFNFSGSLAFQSNKVESVFGLNSLQIFYPEMSATKNRILKSLSAIYKYDKKPFSYGFGIGYGERAPSVTEGYGFYIFNSAERFDYIGNPNLQNEKSWDANAFIGMKNDRISLKLSSSFFRISDFIIGEIMPALTPMTIGARGVKVYKSIDYATIFNTALSSEIKILDNLQWKSQITYSRGKDNNNGNLPYISPISILSSIDWQRNKFSSEISVWANSKQQHFSGQFGESETAGFAILNANVGYWLSFAKTKILLKTGVENILDKHYTTYSDWNKIPRPGRNFFLNISVKF